MSKFKTLLVLAAGYIAGSAAGRQRYEQIRAGAKRVADNPRVQGATKKAQDTLVEKGPVVADLVKRKTAEAASAVTDKVQSSDEPIADIRRPGGVQRDGV